MLTIIFGLPGSGKTTTLALFAARALHGKPLRIGTTSIQSIDKYDAVYSNAPIKGCRQLPLEYIGHYAPRRSLVMIDESVMIADSRDYRNLDKSLMMFFKQHRKYECDCILCSQGFRDNDLRLRDLCSTLLYVERSSFGRSRVSLVDKAQRIDRTIEEQYELAGFLHRKTFFRRRYYPLFDTLYIHGKPLPEMPDLPVW